MVSRSYWLLQCSSHANPSRRASADKLLFFNEIAREPRRGRHYAGAGRSEQRAFAPKLRYFAAGHAPPSQSSVSVAEPSGVSRAPEAVGSTIGKAPTS